MHAGAIPAHVPRAPPPPQPGDPPDDVPALPVLPHPGRDGGLLVDVRHHDDGGGGAAPSPRRRPTREDQIHRECSDLDGRANAMAEHVPRLCVFLFWVCVLLVEISKSGLIIILHMSRESMR